MACPIQHLGLLARGLWASVVVGSLSTAASAQTVPPSAGARLQQAQPQNIRKQLQRGLVFETGLAPPAVDEIDSAARPLGCAGVQRGSALVCP